MATKKIKAAKKTASKPSKSITVKSISSKQSASIKNKITSSVKNIVSTAAGKVGRFLTKPIDKPVAGGYLRYPSRLRVAGEAAKTAGAVVVGWKAGLLTAPYAVAAVSGGAGIAASKVKSVFTRKAVGKIASGAAGGYVLAGLTGVGLGFGASSLVNRYGGGAQTAPLTTQQTTTPSMTTTTTTQSNFGNTWNQQTYATTYGAGSPINQSPNLQTPLTSTQTPSVSPFQSTVPSSTQSAEAQGAMSGISPLLLIGGAVAIAYIMSDRGR